LACFVLLILWNLDWRGRIGQCDCSPAGILFRLAQILGQPVAGGCQARLASVEAVEALKLGPALDNASPGAVERGVKVIEVWVGHQSLRWTIS
jgi:hypothetical protein